MTEFLKNYGQICNIVQETVIKTIPKKNKFKKAKCLSEEERSKKKKREKGKGVPS